MNISIFGIHILICALIMGDQRKQEAFDIGLPKLTAYDCSFKITILS